MEHAIVGANGNIPALQISGFIQIINDPRLGVDHIAQDPIPLGHRISRARIRIKGVPVYEVDNLVSFQVGAHIQVIIGEIGPGKPDQVSIISPVAVAVRVSLSRIPVPISVAIREGFGPVGVNIAEVVIGAACGHLEGVGSGHGILKAFTDAAPVHITSIRAR